MGAQTAARLSTVEGRRLRRWQVDTNFQKVQKRRVDEFTSLQTRVQEAYAANLNVLQRLVNLTAQQDALIEATKHYSDLHDEARVSKSKLTQHLSTLTATLQHLASCLTSASFTPLHMAQAHTAASPVPINSEADSDTGSLIDGITLQPSDGKVLPSAGAGQLSDTS